MAWVAAAAALILGAVILKSAYDSNSKIYRCPYCNLVIKKGTISCPRCKREMGWV